MLADGVRIVQLPPTERTVYNEAGQVIEHIDAVGRSTKYKYNANGQVTEVQYEDPDGNGPQTAPIELSEYDIAGRLVEQTYVLGVKDSDPGRPTGDEDDLVMSYVYDDLGRKISETDGNGDTTTYAYDFENNLLSMTDAVGNTTEYFYDDWNRTEMEIITVDGEELTKFYEYDLVGNLTKEIDRNGRQFEYGYDQSDRLVEERWIDEGVVTNTITTTYDQHNRVYSMADDFSAYTYLYDDLDRVVEVRNFIDDSSASLPALTGAAWQNQASPLDVNGDGLVTVAGDFQTLVDDLNSNGPRTLADPPISPDDPNTLGYLDVNGDGSASAIDAAIVQSWINNVGDPSNASDIDTPGVAPVSIAYEYDEDDRLIASSAQIWDEDTSQWRDDYQNTYAYNNRDFLTSLTQQADTVGTNNNAVAYKRVEMIFDVADQLDQINRYASSGTADLVATSSFTYDDAFRLDGLTHSQGALNVLADYDWDYDSNNRVASFSSVKDGTAFYTYDDRDQLTGEFYVAAYRDDQGLYVDISPDGYDNATFQPNLAYQYDQNGNRYRRSELDLPDIFDPAMNINFDPTTQWEPIGDDDDAETHEEAGVNVTATDDFFTDSDTHNRIETDGTYSYLFDDQGNRVAKFIDTDSSGTLNTGDTDIQEYEWDVRNRLLSVTDRDTHGGSETQIVDFIYDMMGHRIGMEVDIDGDGDVADNGDYRERYVWDFLEPGGKGNVVLDFVDDDLDGTAEDDELTARNFWGLGVDQLFAIEEVEGLVLPEDTKWTLTDNLGTIRDVVTYDGTDTTVDEHYTYVAFGTMTNAVDEAGAVISTPLTRYTFTAQEFVIEVGMHQYDARWYDSVTALFVSPDPIEHDQNNKYRPMRNSPTNYTDPTGLEELSKEKLLQFFKVLYGEEGQLFLKGFQKRGVIRVLDGWNPDIFPSNSDLDTVGRIYEIEIAEELDPITASGELWKQLVRASGHGGIRRKILEQISILDVDDVQRIKKMEAQGLPVNFRAQPPRSTVEGRCGPPNRAIWFDLRRCGDRC